MKFKKMKEDPLKGYLIRTTPVHTDELNGTSSFKKEKAKHFKNRKYMIQSKMDVSYHDDLYSKEETPDNRSFKPYIKRIHGFEAGPLLYRVYRYSPEIIKTPFPAELFESRVPLNLICEISSLCFVFNEIVNKILPAFVAYAGQPKADSRLNKIKNIPTKDLFFEPDTDRRAVMNKVVDKTYRLSKLFYCWDGESDKKETPESPFYKALESLTTISMGIRDSMEYFSTTPDPVMLRATVVTMTVSGIREQSYENFEGDPKGLLSAPYNVSMRIFHEHYGLAGKIEHAIRGLIYFIWYLEQCILYAIPENEAEAEVIADMSLAFSYLLDDIVKNAVLDSYPEDIGEYSYNLNLDIFYKRNMDLVDLVNKTGLNYNLDNTASLASRPYVTARIAAAASDITDLTGLQTNGTPGDLAAKALYTYHDPDAVLDILEPCVDDCFKIIKSHQ